ncbi:MAG: hypothetical protein CMJ53_04575 [Planctomycetaceae bacterium]|nr:hypothetical protein [Planctomycetaceae bacterium]
MSRRGGLLLEVMISMALFIGAALVVLRVMGDARTSLQRSAVLQRAVDLAMTRVGELELGLVSLADLRAMGRQERGEFEDFEATADPLGIRVRTERTQWDGLVLLELDVLDPERTDPTGDDFVVHSVRTLVRLFEETFDDFEEDPMLDDLPGIDEPSLFDDEVDRFREVVR